MRTTTQLQRQQWQGYFDAFTRKYLPDDTSGMVAIEVMSIRLGDQIYSPNARLLGLSYDPKDDVFEIQLTGSNHQMFRPKEIWVLEADEDDLVAVFELVDGDGMQELLHVRKVGPLMQLPDEMRQR